MLLGSSLTVSSAGDLQSQISAGKAAASSLNSQIARDTAQIHVTTQGLAAADQHLTQLQNQLTAREDQLRDVQTALLKARDRLVDLENWLERATHALAANLVATYENGQPDLVRVILQAHGFNQLLDQVDFMHRVGTQDAQIVAGTRTARPAVAREARAARPARAARSDASPTRSSAQRNQVAALQAALLHQQIAGAAAREQRHAKLHALNAQLSSLEAQGRRRGRAGRRHRQRRRGRDRGRHRRDGASASGRAGRGGAGDRRRQCDRDAPLHLWRRAPSFHADGYDCSGSVSYALAAAGLVSSPMVSGQFEDSGDPGPGRWVTITPTPAMSGWRSRVGGSTRSRWPRAARAGRRVVASSRASWSATRRGFSPVLSGPPSAASVGPVNPVRSLSLRLPRKRANSSIPACPRGWCRILPRDEARSCISGRARR